VLHGLCRKGIDRLQTTPFAGCVFDYDGSLCEPHARFEPLSPSITANLNKLLSRGATIGIATGRGGSAAERIGEAVKEEFWDNVIMGFYNGAVVSSLRKGPPVKGETDKDVVRLEHLLRQSSLFRDCTFRSNVSQIAISLPALEEPDISVHTAMAVVEHAGMRATVSCSSHSIDVIFGQAGKTAVVDAVRKHVGAAADAPVLRIGDKGRWPGNDAELLDDPFGLSVDEVSPSTEACWGLSPRGVLGVQAMSYYLDRISWRQGTGLIHFD
jgi:hydroxymethylpyrimidine pyrophosphatase-like HAD family hydrolase